MFIKFFIILFILSLRKKKDKKYLSRKLRMRWCNFNGYRLGGNHYE